MKNQLNARLSDQITERINQLQSWLNESKTGVVTTAINQLYETERTKRMDTNALTEAVARAVARLQADGIEGWGLNNPDPETFDSVETRPASGCTSETCNHNSHDPASPDYKLILKDGGKLVDLGYERNTDETDMSYYALVSDTAARFFRFTQGRAFWAHIDEIDANGVPEWAMASLAK